MKNKSLSFHIFFTVVVFVFCACKKTDMPPVPQSSPFAVSIDNSSFTSAGGTANISVTAGSDGWWLAIPANTWLTITKLFGSGDLKIPVTVKPNTTGAARSIQVIVSPTFNLKADTLILNQSN